VLLDELLLLCLHTPGACKCGQHAQVQSHTQRRQTGKRTGVHRHMPCALI
jgi:hypothetical protein